MLLKARQLFEIETHTPEFFAAVSMGANAVGKAHAALRAAVETDNFSSAEVAKWVGEIENYIKSVTDFYTSINE